MIPCLILGHTLTQLTYFLGHLFLFDLYMKPYQFLISFTITTHTSPSNNNRHENKAFIMTLTLTWGYLSTYQLLRQVRFSSFTLKTLRLVVYSYMRVTMVDSDARNTSE